MGFFITLIIFIIVIIFLFSSKTFSPIPYFPSQSVDLPKIIKALNLKNNQTVFDLGAGDGKVIFSAAKSSFQRKLNTKFIAVEINPVLILILHIRRIFHQNKKNIKIIRDNIFEMNLNSLTSEPVNFLTVYLYISPWFLEKVIENCKMNPPAGGKNFSVVSYMYPIKSLKNREKTINGKNKIFVYR